MTASNQSLQQRYALMREKSEREDMVMFINACFAATRQNEFYTDRDQQTVSIEFLHQYVLFNYRALYRRLLAVDINHFNAGFIIANLLAAGAPAEPAARNEEGQLIARALGRLPPNRVFGLFKTLQQRRVNNRRTRATIREYLRQRREPEFDAIKYRSKYIAATRHAHLSMPRELGLFLYDFKRPRKYDNHLLQQFRTAHYSEKAIYDLPFTIAQSLAHRHGIPQKTFLKRIEPKMTSAEKLRMQKTTEAVVGQAVQFDLARAGVTRLALYILSLSKAGRAEKIGQLNDAMQRSARRTSVRRPLALGKVAAVLDRSASTAGSREKRNRSLAVAMGVDYLLKASSREYRAFWTPKEEVDREGLEEFESLKVTPNGQTAIADSLIEALRWSPELIIIVSDGYENDPPRGAQQVAEIYRRNLATEDAIPIIHANPVFDSQHYSPRPLGAPIATVGLRDAEDLATMIGFARWASGDATLKMLDEYLQQCATAMLQ